MAYSGTHETTKFGERDSGNAVLVEIAAHGAPPQITPLRTGALRWKSIETEIRAPGDLARLRAEIEAIADGDTTLVDLSLRGVLYPAEQAELRRIEELLSARLLFGRCDGAQLLPAPADDGWLAGVPAGPLQDAARRLQELAVPAAAGRPDGATPEVAAHALVELYALVEEAPR